MLKKIKNSKPVMAAQVVAVDYCKIIKGALYAAAGAAGAYLLQASSTIDFGKYQILAAAVLSIAANLLHKWQSELDK